MEVRWLQGGCWLAVPSFPRDERKGDWKEMVAVQEEEDAEESTLTPFPHKEAYRREAFTG